MRNLRARGAMLVCSMRLATKAFKADPTGDSNRTNGRIIIDDQASLCTVDEEKYGVDYRGGVVEISLPSLRVR